MNTILRSLRELYEIAAELPAAERMAFVAACADADVRDRLARMIDAAPGADGALPRTPAVGLAAALDDSAPVNLPPGSRIGPFELLDVIGEGGSSTVFRATRSIDGVRQDVALKLLRRGLYSPDAQRQFRRERRALTQLEHPGIARLIEGGVTETGLAYIALELVAGVPITEYARTHRLDVRSRLRLFLDVCRAVDAAHRALIVHRDLKPSNVLVSTDGTVKLLDFGIAKLLDADDETQTRMPAFTPAYAAPEQRTGGLATTATDVYALGVLLGELMTGTRLGADGARTPSGCVGENTSEGVLPAAPRTTRRQLRGDLDNIVIKAIAAEPLARYASAGALADDVQRLLDGRPVAAHAPSPWYRARKFAGRHRGGVAAAAVVLAAVLVGAVTVLVQSEKVRQQAERANAQRDFLVSVFEAAGANSPKDRRPSVDDIVDEATARLRAQDTLPDALRADLLLTLAKVARSVGAHDRALDLLDRADPLIARTGGGRDETWWTAQVLRAGLLLDKSRRVEAIALLEPLRAELLAREDRIGIQGQTTLADALLHQGRIDEGLALFRQSVQTAEKHAQAMPDTLLTASIDEASQLMDALRFAEGLQRADATFALWRSQGEPPNRSVIELYAATGLAAEATGDLARAELGFREAIALGDRYFDKPNPTGAWNVGLYGSFLIAQGRFDEAEPYARRGLELRRAVYGDNDPHTLNGVAGMCKLYVGRRDYDSALQWCSQGVDTCREHAVDDVVCARLQAIRGRILAAMGRTDAADDDLRVALAAQRARGGESTLSYAYILDNLAFVQLAEHDYTQALATNDKVLATYRDAKGGLLQAQLLTRYWRALALYELERNAEALAEISDIEPRYAALFPLGVMRFDMLALHARALARAQHADAARETAQHALNVHAPPKTDTHVIEEIIKLAGRSATSTAATAPAR